MSAARPRDVHGVAHLEPPDPDRRLPGSLDFAYVLGPFLLFPSVAVIAVMELLKARPTPPPGLGLLLVGTFVLATSPAFLLLWLLRRPRQRPAVELLLCLLLALPWAPLLTALGLSLTEVQLKLDLVAHPPPWLAVPWPIAVGLTALGVSTLAAFALRRRGLGADPRRTLTAGERLERTGDRLRRFLGSPWGLALLGRRLPGALGPVSPELARFRRFQWVYSASLLPLLAGYAYHHRARLADPTGFRPHPAEVVAFFLLAAPPLAGRLKLFRAAWTARSRPRG